MRARKGAGASTSASAPSLISSWAAWSIDSIGMTRRRQPPASGASAVRTAASAIGTGVVAAESVRSCGVGRQSVSDCARLVAR